MRLLPTATAAPTQNHATSNTNRRSRRRRSRHAALWSSTVVALMLSSGITPAQCFGTLTASAVIVPEQRTAATSSTRRYFRNTADSTAASSTHTTTAFTPDVFSSSSSSFGVVAPATSTTATTTATTSLPTWLQDRKDAYWESNWERLRYSMLQSSFFTPHETQSLLSAIETAAQGNRHQMAGAAEFCLILVESMEMGLTALIAAAFHYCSCVTARQEEQHHHHHHHHELDYYYHEDMFLTNIPNDDPSYGDHATLIAKDAARLKTLEMVAARIYADKAASRVTPDAMDSQNLRMLLLSEAKDWRALAIRSAAALYRLRGILNNNNYNEELTPEALQVSREALHIYAPLASRLGMHRLKNELEGAAFKILYRRQYERVNRLARELRPRHSRPHLNRGLVEMCDHSLDLSSCMRNVLQTVQTDMTTLLEQDPEFGKYVQDFSVTARVKEPYSMWKKMLRNGCQHITEVPDAIALRIVLDAKPLTPNEDHQVKRARERALCYYAQKLCMDHWRPVQPDARFKDYIERPKHNGYQSLHYTAHTSWDNEDWNLEIQVRSGEMHQVAEFGLASHWDYKYNSQHHHQHHQSQSSNYHNNYYTDNNNNNDVTMAASSRTDPDAYLRSVQEWHWQQHAGQSLFGGGVPNHHLQHDTSSSNNHNNNVDDNTFSSSNNVATDHTLGSHSEASERAERIRARTKKLKPYIEALTEAQSDLAREHVFVFLTFADGGGTGGSSDNAGKVLSLPAGACVLDALREGERHLGLSFPYSWNHDDDHVISLNGQPATKVTSKLQNGDILMVPYSSSGSSSSTTSPSAMTP